MNKLHRFLTLMTLTAAISIPAVASAGDSHRRSDSRRGETQVDARHRSDSSRGHGHHTTRVVTVGGGHHGSHHGHHTVYVPAPRHYEPMYLGDDGLHGVLWQLDRTPFSSERVDILRDVARRYTMSAHQAHLMVARLTFSSDRVTALELFYPRVYDKQNWYQVYDLLTFSSDRDDLRRRCSRY